VSPIRILVLAILFYLAYRLITGGGKKKTVEPHRRKDSEETILSDTLEEDPICKKLVPRQQAVHLQHDEKTYYFCSQECCKKFRKQQGEEK
jgi:YHS domain-containing protein